ncbi:hypothetical protein FOZ60_001707 [Perkinsus olseni]|uniref:AP2/ERF domain-containing protein n=1 Tax=Perkinsus olseni TaxID=32597 RepID=A0A7J6NZR5_PEROL|nr:hypothetical protein FOZ60_001707 [Perkinsus olseni]
MTSWFPRLGRSILAGAGQRPPSLWSSCQARGFAGRAGGLKRLLKSRKPGTVWQTGIGKRMELWWPQQTRKSRTPFYENSRLHLIYDFRLKRWSVMWYRYGLQVFRQFSVKGRSEKFEKARMEALILFRQLRRTGKLGRARPDVCPSGVRGVHFDQKEKAWTCWWGEAGVRRYAVFPTADCGGFDASFKEAVKLRTEKNREQYKFWLQRYCGPRPVMAIVIILIRSRHRSARFPLGDSEDLDMPLPGVLFLLTLYYC